ncbi:Patatin [Labilithrix luteola]|uniref:Patatin n=1 Tax=Labilithrix luteola TaxID=1391654 RepID=A0A0K1PW31_9BACT|nr:patatin-like phospholipase family protein [Labilithrix luteola]AKU97725.1 Patatin [Labilithrix luteola]
MGENGEDPRALVLAGAVAKGAFEAGVTRALARNGIGFDRFVGASAGALNATLLAAGAALGRFDDATELLETLWRDQASILNFARPTLAPLQGLSTTEGVEAIVLRALRTLFARGRPSQLESIKLTIVTTDLRGAPYAGELTHEDDHHFFAEDFADELRWPVIARVAAASSAFPGLFVPPTLPDGGQRVDGGAVNNAPISYVIDKNADRNRIVVVSAEPNARPEGGTLRGTRLLTRLVDILVNERIGRDLVVAKEHNATLELLEDAMERAALSEAQRIVVRNALGWRHLDILTVRPAHDLEGGAFGGLFWKPFRVRQIEEGKRAAHLALSGAIPKESPVDGAVRDVGGATKYVSVTARALGMFRRVSLDDQIRR